MKFPIYLDYNATTPVDERVFNAMKPFFMEQFGNAASSGHAFGNQAKAAVENARATIAKAINATPEEIIFTSGATESNNLAIKGADRMLADKGNHIITAVTEHKAVLDTCKALEKDGVDVTYLTVDSEGSIYLSDLANAIADRTILVSLMHGNNEIGTLHDIQKIGEICRERGVWFHTDSTQTIGKIPFDVQVMNVDMASLTAHKIYGPKGVGALYVRNGCKVIPQIDGGGHESGMRSGTLNVPGIVGFAKSIEVAVADMERDIAHCSRLRNRLWEYLKPLDGVMLNGPNPLTQPHKRLPNNLSVSFSGDNGELIAGCLMNVAVSSRSACTSASNEPSHVLRAIGRTNPNLTTLRFGIGRMTTDEEIDYTIECMRTAIEL
jgi:cysteine desulfurase